MTNNYQPLAKALTDELIEQANLTTGDLFVLGISTSEIQGHRIGKDSSLEIGREIIETIADTLTEKKIHLAVQGCEHINRSLVVEKEVAKKFNLQEVTVKPALHAGGAGTVAYYEKCKQPTVVEHIVADAGIDIGDTSIGMHVKHVQVPVRLSSKTLGEAHITALKSRPKLIGGERAHYPS